MEISSKILEKYDLLQHQYLKDTGCDSVLLRHKKTGARVALLPSEDDNKVFYIGFRTPPEDSTGVAHIIEHSRIPHASGGFHRRCTYHRALCAVRLQGFSGQGSFYRTCEGFAQHLPQCYDLSGQDCLPGGELQRHGFQEPDARLSGRGVLSEHL